MATQTPTSLTQTPPPFTGPEAESIQYKISCFIKLYKLNGATTLIQTIVVLESKSFLWNIIPFSSKSNQFLSGKHDRRH